MNNRHFLKIGYLTAQDPTNKRSWSGTHYFMLQELEGRFGQVIILGPVKTKIWIKNTLIIFNGFHKLVFGKKFNRQHNNLLSIYYARQFRRKIRRSEIDILVAPAASTEIAHLKSQVPIIYISDTSFNQIKDYYETYSNFSAWSNKFSDRIEQKAILNSRALVYSSNWAADHARKHYKIGKIKVYVFPFGANIDKVSSRKDVPKEFTGTLNLLFLGRQWERKGGPLVVETVRKLNKAGYKVHLTICGCSPPIEIEEQFITVYKFLDKNKEDENDIFLKIMYGSHLLFLPTKADCTPIVFCEAAAFGLPVLSRDTGGVNSIIRQGENGILLPETAEAQDYYNVLVGLLENPEQLKEMSGRSRSLFETKLNWTIWGDSIEKVILELKK